jgi:hypothetical protein
MRLGTSNRTTTFAEQIAINFQHMFTLSSTAPLQRRPPRTEENETSQPRSHRRHLPRPSSSSRLRRSHGTRHVIGFSCLPQSHVNYVRASPSNAQYFHVRVLPSAISRNANSSLHCFGVLGAIDITQTLRSQPAPTISTIMLPLALQTSPFQQ